MFGQQQRRRIALLAPPAEDVLRLRHLARRDLVEHAENVVIGKLRVVIAGDGRAVEHHRHQPVAIGLLQLLHELGQYVHRDHQSLDAPPPPESPPPKPPNPSPESYPPKPPPERPPKVDRPIIFPRISPGKKPPPAPPPRMSQKRIDESADHDAAREWNWRAAMDPPRQLRVDGDALGLGDGWSRWSGPRPSSLRRTAAGAAPDASRRECCRPSPSGTIGSSP